MRERDARAGSQLPNSVKKALRMSKGHGRPENVLVPNVSTTAVQECGGAKGPLPPTRDCVKCRKLRRRAPVAPSPLVGRRAVGRAHRRHRHGHSPGDGPLLAADDQGAGHRPRAVLHRHGRRQSGVGLCAPCSPAWSPTATAPAASWSRARSPAWPASTSCMLPDRASTCWSAAC